MVGQSHNSFTPLSVKGMMAFQHVLQAFQAKTNQQQQQEHISNEFITCVM
jgi:hypothetical protein